MHDPRVGQRFRAGPPLWLTHASTGDDRREQRGTSETSHSTIQAGG